MHVSSSFRMIEPRNPPATTIGAGTISMQSSGQTSWQPPQRMHSVPSSASCS